MNKIVLVQFGEASPGGKEYAYFTRLGLKVGDIVAVETPRQLAITTVTTVDDISDRAASYASKWIVDLIDVEAHKQALAKEMEAIKNG